MRSVCCAIILTCAASFAQPVYQIGGDVKPPVLFHKQDPEYSEAARAARLQGSVVLSAVIDAEGNAREMHIVKSLGLGLDEKAIDAVINWRFHPATKAYVPVAVETTIEVNFRLPVDQRAWLTTRVAFDTPQGATGPVLIESHSQPAAGLEEHAAVRVSFDVDLQGIPQNIQVDDSSDPKFDDEVIALIREWRFQAALNSGRAIEVRAAVDFTRGVPIAVPARAETNGQPVMINGVPMQPPQKKR
jgi:TonB family protein